MPTPFGIIYAFAAPKDVLAIEAAYEKAMIAEVKRLCDAIPHEHLCIQWDFCHEMISLDGQPQDWFPPQGASQPEIMARMQRICAPVPADVELGIHFCYGDFGAKHFIEPKDASRMVDVANDMAKAVGRLINYMHFPVPVDRTDARLFRTVRETQARSADGDLSRRRPCVRRCRWRDRADRDGARIRSAIRYCNRVRHRARAQARSGSRILDTYAGASRNPS